MSVPTANYATREAQCVIRDDQPDAREGQAGRAGVAERLVVTAEAGQCRGREGASVQDRRKTW